MALNEMISAKLTSIKGKLDIFPYINDAVVLGALIGLSYIGIALTRVSPQAGHLYWMVMIPVFGAISLLAQWQLVRADSQKWSRLLRRQLFHWIALWVAVHLTYRLLDVGLLTPRVGRFRRRPAPGVCVLYSGRLRRLALLHRRWVPRPQPPGGHVSYHLSMDNPSPGHRVRGRCRVVHQNAEARAGGLYAQKDDQVSDQGPAD